MKLVGLPCIGLVACIWGHGGQQTMCCMGAHWRHEAGWACASLMKASCGAPATWWLGCINTERCSHESCLPPPCFPCNRHTRWHVTATSSTGLNCSFETKCGLPCFPRNRHTRWQTAAKSRTSGAWWTWSAAAPCPTGALQCMLCNAVPAARLMAELGLRSWGSELLFVACVLLLLVLAPLLFHSHISYPLP